MPATSIDLPPTYLSSLVMLAVLPATWIPVIKNREACDLSFVNHENYHKEYEQFRKQRHHHLSLEHGEYLNRSIVLHGKIWELNKRKGVTPCVQHLESQVNILNDKLAELSEEIEDLEASYWKHPANIISSDMIDGMETFTVEPCADIRENSCSDPDYQVFFCGNGQDAQQVFYKKAQANRKSSRSLVDNTHYTYWNYPGVARSTGVANTTDDLVDAGYKQVKRLLNNNIPADKITLYGLSLGGGVAAQVAKRLHQEGDLVHLTIDRSFSSVAAVVPATFAKMNQKNKCFRLIMPSVTLSIAGLALGVVIAGLIASIGIFLARFTTPMIAPFITHSFDFVGSIAGAAIGLSALVIGAIVGVALGVLISLQYIWTDQPYTLPMEAAFNALLQAASCDMNSADAIQAMIAVDKPHSKIKIINTVDDSVIPQAASLNEALGFKAEEAAKVDDSRQLQEKVTSFWYHKGGHCGSLQEQYKISVVESPLI